MVPGCILGSLYGERKSQVACEKASVILSVLPSLVTFCPEKTPSVMHLYFFETPILCYCNCCLKEKSLQWLALLTETSVNFHLRGWMPLETDSDSCLLMAIMQFGHTPPAISSGTALFH